MGHREPWRAQLAIWSRVVRAYCIAPFLGSCEGRGTSRRIPPETGRRVESWVAAGSREVADLGGVVEMHAAGAARMRELERTEGAVSSGQLMVDGKLDVVGVPRSARRATDLESENMAIASWCKRDRMLNRWEE
jgi:hypothetical protein